MITHHDPSILARENLLHIEDLYKCYRKKEGTVIVLENVDLSIKEGEFVSIVGPTGCGKSTLLKIILGEERQSSGIVLVDQKPAGFPDTTRGIVYQNYDLFENRSVLDNVLFGPQLKGHFWEYWINKKELIEKAMYYLEMVKLSDDVSKFPDELSGGMKQRVAIAQALIMEPKILLMDEPFGALDPSTREDLQTSMLEIHEKFNMTIFFVTHELEEALYLGTRIVVLSYFYKNMDEVAEINGEIKRKRGSRVVWDTSVPGESKASATTVKDSPMFREMIKEIKDHGFDPAHLQRISDFNLTHPDSFQTLTLEEGGIETKE